MKTPVEIGNLIQICIIVKDIEKTLASWCDTFNVPMPKINVMEPCDVPGVTYRGKPAHYGRKLAVIRVPDQNYVFEFIQPTGGESSFQEFLDKHGEGVHHLGYAMGEKRDAIVSELYEKGFAERHFGAGVGNSWTHVDTEEALGVNLNIKIK